MSASDVVRAGRFRKKPIVVDAWQWNGGSFIKTAPPWVLDYVRDGFQVRLRQDSRLNVPTLEGLMVADIGDWIIKGVKGELYPCKPDIFATTYDAVETKPGVVPCCTCSGSRRWHGAPCPDCEPDAHRLAIDAQKASAKTPTPPGDADVRTPGSGSPAEPPEVVAWREAVAHYDRYDGAENTEACIDAGRALATRLVEATELLRLTRAIALEAFKEWDSDNDHRVGKILKAVAGRNPGYRPDTDRIAAFLAPPAGGQR